jgi:hypothetical protein
LTDRMCNITDSFLKSINTDSFIRSRFHVVSRLEDSLLSVQRQWYHKKQASLFMILSTNYHHINIDKAEFIDFFYCHFSNIRVKFEKNELRILIVMTLKNVRATYEGHNPSLNLTRQKRRAG